MDKIKLRTISLIENSDLKRQSKDNFIEIINNLSDRNCLKILRIARDSRNSLNDVWEDLVSKFYLISRVEQSDLLDSEQKEIFKKTVIESMDKDDLNKIYSFKDIDLEKIKEENSELKESYKKERERLERSKEKIIKTINGILGNKREEADNRAIKEVRDQINS